MCSDGTGLFRVCGALPDVQGLRDYKYSEICESVQEVNLTDFKIENENMPNHIFDQGSISSCVACALASVLEVLNYKSTGTYVKLSPGFIYGSHRDYAGKGMIVSKTVESLLNYGTVDEKLFNELYEMPDIQEIVKNRDDLKKIAEALKISGFVNLTDTRSKMWNNIKDAFLRYKLPMIAVSNTFFKGGSHCVMIYGFNESDSDGKSLYFQNSWGEDYMDNGKSVIPFDKVNSVWLLLKDPIKFDFEDVSEDSWYYKNILHMKASGIVNGTSEKTFEPDRPVTRGELCAILDRLCKKQDENDNAMIRSIYDILNR